MGRRVRTALSLGLRLLLVVVSLWALTGPIDRSPLVVGAAILPPSVLEAGATSRAAIFFPETGYIVGTGPIGQYFAARGGARTFGPPVSNEFTLLGSRVQIFRDFVLKQDAGGGVSTVDLYGANAVPFRIVGNWNVPEIDQGLLASTPVPGSPEYGAQVQAFIKANAPDTWDGLAVGFFQAFAGTVLYEEAFPDETGDRGLLTGFAHEVWGLPVSGPQRDPQQAGIVYLRWERGVMVWNSQTGAVSSVPLGEAFRSVITGEGLSPEQAAAAAGSPYLSQANGPLPDGVVRPTDLPDTALADAFTRSSSVAAGAVAAQIDPTPTLEGWYSPATPTATPFVNTGVPGNPNGVGQPGVNVPPPPGGVPPVPGQALPGAIVPGAPAAPAGPAGSDPCYGDEQITFSPEILRVGNEVLIAVTSARPHPYGRLAGTERTTFVRERPGQKGYVWEWTILLSYPGQHEYTFYVDSTIPCKKVQMTVRQGLSTKTPTPTKTATPWGWNGNDNNNNNNNDNNGNNARAPAIFPASYVIPNQDAYNCNSFQSQAQAQSVLRYDASDPNRLDAEDGVEDGIACTTFNYSAYPNDRDFGVVQRTFGTPTPTIIPIGMATLTRSQRTPGVACWDFPSGQTAQDFLWANPHDPKYMDYRRDGFACGGADAPGFTLFMSEPLNTNRTPVPTPIGGP